MAYGSGGPSIGGGGGGIITAAGGGVAGAGSLAYTGFQSFSIALIAAVLILGGVLLFRITAIRAPKPADDVAA